MEQGNGGIGQVHECRLSHLKSGLSAFLFIQQQLRNAQSLHSVHILDIVEALAQSYVSVNALAHSQ
jgi:hypothetical protein